MAEWLKAHAWKVCVPQKGTAGSNPALSARKISLDNLKKNIITLLSLNHQISINHTNGV
jgi:hypothetical protein